MKKILIPLLMILLIGGRVLAQTETVMPARTSPLYALMTFPIDIDPSLYKNPFDSSDIELVGVFQSPSGRQVVIPGFWMQPYTDQCQQPCQVEDLQPSGSPTWQVRYSPDEVGHWTYNLQVRDNGTTVKIEQGDFAVTPSDNPGFIGLSSANRRYFEYDNRQSYFPIGNDFLSSWAEGGGLVTYQKWLQQLSDAGGNYARLLIDDPWFIGLEWNGAAGDYRNSQEAAARLDAVLNMAAQYGIALQLVILWHQALINYTGAPVTIPSSPPRPDMSADWSDYGYNVANGGPLSGPALFFSDDQAKALFRERLRYIAARWGYSPNIFSWEMIDEIDHTTNYDPTVASAWLHDMASYLRQVDQDRHLITAGSRDDDPAIESNPLLSFTESRFFQKRPIETLSDQIVGSLDAIRQNLQLVSSPTLLTFSLNPWFEPTGDDPNGISVQTTLWASAFSGAGGGGMSAWGETYIAPLGLEKYYPALAAFASEVDWAHLHLQPADAALLSDDPSIYQPVRINNFLRGYGKPTGALVTHQITADGVLPDMSSTSSYLYGTVYNKDQHHTQEYSVTVPVDTYFEAHIRQTSTQAGARLDISVDGKSAAELVLSAGAKDVGLRVPLSAGSHDITLENMGDDWLELDYLEVGQLITPVRSLTLRDSQAGVALSWLQYRTYTWDHINEPRPPLLFTYRVDQMPAGTYTVEIWSPLTGAQIGQEVANVGDDGVLQVDLVPMSDELAIHAVRQAGAQPITITPTIVTTEEVTATPSPTATTIPTATLTATITLSPTLFSIATNTSLPTATSSNTPTATKTPTATYTATASSTPSATATFTPTKTRTSTPSATATAKPSATPIHTAAPTATPSPEATATATLTESIH